MGEGCGLEAIYETVCSHIVHSDSVGDFMKSRNRVGGRRRLQSPFPPGSRWLLRLHMHNMYKVEHQRGLVYVCQWPDSK